MKTTAAVLFEAGKPFELMELDLDGPGPGEVLVKYTAAGLCHSDLHLTDGDLPPRFPIVGGHEGSGVIEEVGAGVTRVKPGDHVVCSFIPNCGTCRYCCTGRQNLCDMGATILEGCMPDGSFRFHSQGTDFGAMCMLGTFAERATVSQHSVVKVDDWLPLETAVLVGCGVPSGWGTAVNAGNLRAGDTAVIYGVGGLGITRSRARPPPAVSTSWWWTRWLSSGEPGQVRRHPCLRRRRQRGGQGRRTHLGAGRRRGADPGGHRRRRGGLGRDRGDRQGRHRRHHRAGGPGQTHRARLRNRFDAARENDQGLAVRFLQSAIRHRAAAAPLRRRPADAGRTRDHHLQPRTGEPGLPGSAGRQEHSGRDRALTSFHQPRIQRGR
ncbi:Putative zinc-type alcohol dehydrogenase AdhD (aldehyde reductase) [Mycobacterium tuberculosis CAS/NITR204]|uniref:Putative zinc-type alcohol dehydrogenase AdhD (Aldehyde reductase) n=1 Tax=Mycobacterium tuberculosis CAS/NITR204 TaxID=1310114 RepID=R4MM22_MYCTX|nr:Putative zinc-type alcohol dehydrogenase AdhD (aldehyde reductase) [Mycobacterium tuberculosis CAS/NITR204]